MPFERPESSMSLRPVAVEPVKESRSTSRCESQCRANGRAEAGHDIENPRRDSCLQRKLRKFQGRAWGELRGFEHDGVARSECRSKLDHRVNDWKVPRNNGPDHATRLIGVEEKTLELRGATSPNSLSANPADERKYMGREGFGIIQGCGNRLPHLERIQEGEFRLVLTMRSASFMRISPRLMAGNSDQQPSSNRTRAMRTASSTSSGLPTGKWLSGVSLAGLTLWKSSTAVESR